MSNGRTNCIINLGKYEQSKSITITSNGVTTIIPDEGKVLNSVSINTKVPVKQEQTKSITITTNGTTTITPDSGKVLSSVEVTTNINTLKNLLDTTQSTIYLFKLSIEVSCP